MAPYYTRDSSYLEEVFNGLFYAAICASMMSRCGTWAGGSMPALPNWTVGGTRALGLIKRQVVPPLAGIDTLSQTKI